ncbi:imidazole glycerol phosphate synthase subunit HisH [Alkalilimnicola sp. S0819]|uniref:imidazole glycerol phosphate synthase subunit HisH n=1 Tax=Alkalilimnicola sp. S0819 TaxID=2613922 RepID=UPI001261D447|nr:imidazole glycerol phosphate synthase subunit HisH [Alkalilimnicola sp. S0819]KAB7627254.1 imidazole glycerol phosphate synthase subunit HisH [Alkalilimnicola sp. S0819]MPQ15967.1 imidazole glycerol phosphate synthase subunit HisH [Alkalilimnicola sp. S0819]
MSSIAVIDYGMGNLRSVAKALQHVGGGARVSVTSDAEEIRRADRVVFPGQGAARDCMAELHRLELVEVIREVAAEKPFLGVCMGMQVLLDRSEEGGGVDCLGLLPGQVRHFRHILGAHSALKVPHMGWNRVAQAARHPLWAGIEDRSWFYFVHSYFADPATPELTLGRSDYGAPFSAVIGRENIFAAQFHPEKSQHAGLTLLGNFLRWDGTV